MLWIKIVTFVKSLWFHVQRGLPKATQEEINHRHAICVSCEEYNTQKKECNVCGCNINTKRIFLNKLAWADQECPINKWSKIER